MTLHGSGAAASWTRRALERGGYCISEDETGAQVRVLESGWELRLGSVTQRCDSLAALLAALQALPAVDI